MKRIIFLLMGFLSLALSGIYSQSTVRPEELLKARLSQDTIQITPEFTGYEVKIFPTKPIAGKQFDLILSSKVRLDVQPEIDFGSLTPIISRPKVGMSMDQRGSKYTYTFILKADSAGFYKIAPFDVIVNRKAYKVDEFNIEVREDVGK